LKPGHGDDKQFYFHAAKQDSEG
jgi:hypothetical protein